MTSMEELLELAAAGGLSVHWRPMGGRRGEYRHESRRISLNTSLAADQELCTLAHELGHAHHGDTSSTPNLERRADDYAARLLIAPAEYALAERLHGPHPGAIAKELGVTREIIAAWQAALNRLTPMEWAS